MDDVQFACSRQAEVYREALGMRPSVSDLHHHLLAVLRVPHAQISAQGILQMCTRHAVAVIRVTVAHASSMKFVGVIGSISLVHFLCIQM